MAKRRHKYTAKQLAAGFGGKRGMRRSSSRPGRKNPIRARSSSRKRRRNPVAAASHAPRRRRFAQDSVNSFFANRLLPAGVGALGALALDMALPHIPLPASLQTGPMAPIVRIVGAVAIGYAVGMVAGRKFSQEATAGALTVSIYDIAKGYIADQAAASAPPASPSPGTSAYVDGLGYYSAARRAGRLSAYVH
jgi:hypothetical protein